MWWVEADDGGIVEGDSPFKRQTERLAHALGEMKEEWFGVAERLAHIRCQPMFYVAPIGSKIIIISIIMFYFYIIYYYPKLSKY